MCCNNMVENVDSEWACKQEWMGIKFEYIAAGTPQHNDCVRQKFATLFNRVCAMASSRKFISFWETAYGLKPPILPTFRKIISSLWIEIWAYSNNFWKERETSFLWCKNLVKFVSPCTGIIYNSLSLQSIVTWAFGLVLLKVIWLVSTMCKTPRKK